MKKLFSVLVLSTLGFFVFVGTVLAVAHTVNFTAAQDTQFQTKLIPLYNRDHCKQFGLASNCTSANLVSAGCVVRTAKTLTIESCTIFTSDTTGEDLMIQEILNQKGVEIFARLTANDATKRESAFQGLAPAGQTTACTSLGLSTPDCP